MMTASLALGQKPGWLTLQYVANIVLLSAVLFYEISDKCDEVIFASNGS